MKNTLLLLTLFLASFTFGQFDFDIDKNGFDQLRIGSNIDKLPLKKASYESVPKYAWSPLDTGGGLEQFYDENGNLDEEEMQNALKEARLQPYKFKKEKDAYFHGLPIVALQIAVDENRLIEQIMVTLDKDQMTEVLKAQLVGSFTDMFGDTDCSFSVSFDPPPFYCTWGWDDPHMLTMSDMISPGGGPGKTIHFVFEKNK